MSAGAALVPRVLAALRAIPHTLACPISVPVSGLHPAYIGHLCTCDREQRLAQRVAAAIEAAMSAAGWCAVTHHHAPDRASGTAAALTALGAAPTDDGGTT